MVSMLPPVTPLANGMPQDKELNSESLNPRSLNKNVYKMIHPSIKPDEIDSSNQY